MSEQEALTIVLGALDQLTPRRTDPPTLMELTLCLGYSEAELDEAFTTLFDCPADEALALFSQDALRLRPAEFLSDYPHTTDPRQQLHRARLLLLLPLPLR